MRHPTGSESSTLLSTVSSDGLVNLYDLSSAIGSPTQGEDNKSEPIASYDTKGSRLTCVFLAEGRKEQAKAITNGKGPAPDNAGVTFEDHDASDEDEEDGDAEMYDSAEEDEEEDGEDGVEVEFEDDEEEEAEYED